MGSCPPHELGESDARKAPDCVDAGDSGRDHVGAKEVLRREGLGRPHGVRRKVWPESPSTQAVVRNAICASRRPDDQRVSTQPPLLPTVLQEKLENETRHVQLMELKKEIAHLKGILYMKHVPVL